MLIEITLVPHIDSGRQPFHFRESGIRLNNVSNTNTYSWVFSFTIFVLLEMSS